MYRWKNDLKYPGYEPEQLCYVPKANVDHTISGQGTGVRTLHHSATTPRAYIVIILNNKSTKAFSRTSLLKFKTINKNLTSTFVNIALQDSWDESSNDNKCNPAIENDTQKKEIHKSASKQLIAGLIF